MTRFINAKYYPLRVLISIFILMLLAGTSLSATYYVKNGGSDGADGLSDASAWASISKVNNKDLSAGDIVLFKRDSTWSDTLIPKSSGSAVSPIVFGAYGTGAVPVININYNSSKHRDLYVNGKSNIQIRDLAFLNGTSEGATLYGNVEINNSSSIVLENIVVSGSFCKTAVLIANSSHDISVRNSTVEMTSFPGSTNAEGAGIQVGDFSNFNTCYNVVITGCDVKNNSGAGIVIFESYQNSVFENNVHGNGSAGIWVGGASGSYSHDNIIEKNRVYENCQYQDDAFGIDLYRVGNNNAVRYNLVHDQYDTVYNPSSHTIFNSHLFGSGGIRFDGNNTMSTLNVNGNIAHNNIVYNEYQGFQVIHINNVQIFNNTIYNNKTYSNTSYSSTGISVLSNYPSVETHTSNTIVKNNAVYGKHWMVNDAYSSGTSFNNNVYFCTYDGTHIYFSHDGSGVDTFAGWKSATGYDSLSTFADPSFEAAGTNFRLRSVSQAINAGTVEGISVPSSWTDYAGTSVPQGARPDVGAYEYSAPVVTGTVKVSGSGAAIQWAGVYLLNANSELVSYAVTDSSGNFTIDAASMEGYLFVSPPTSQNGQGYWVYQYQPRFYYKPAASNSGIDIRLPQASTFIIEGRDLSNNLMDVASFEALRANVFSQYISFVNVNDQIQPAMYWQVTNSDGRVGTMPEKQA